MDFFSSFCNRYIVSLLDSPDENSRVLPAVEQNQLKENSTSLMTKLLSPTLKMELVI